MDVKQVENDLFNSFAPPLQLKVGTLSPRAIAKDMVSSRVVRLMLNRRTKRNQPQCNMTLSISFVKMD